MAVSWAEEERTLVPAIFILSSKNSHSMFVHQDLSDEETVDVLMYRLHYLGP